MFRKMAGSLVVGCLVIGAAPMMALAQDNGVIKGKILFKGDKDKFKREKLDTTKDPNCKRLHGEKGIGSEDVILQNGLDRDAAAEARVVTLVHDPHGSLAEGPAKLVAAEF